MLITKARSSRKKSELSEIKLKTETLMVLIFLGSTFELETPLRQRFLPLYAAVQLEQPLTEAVAVAVAVSTSGE